MINIHPYSGPAVKSEKLESYEEMPVPQALSSSSSFATTQDFSTSSANDDIKRYILVKQFKSIISMNYLEELKETLRMSQ